MRLISAGIPRAIAQRVPALAGLALTAVLAAAAPAVAAAPDAVGTATAAAPVGALQQQAPQALQGATQTVPPAPAAVQGATEALRLAAPAVRRAAERLPPAPPQVREAAAPPAGPVVPPSPDRALADPGEAATITAGQATRTAGQLARRVAPGSPLTGDSVDGALQALGDTLRSVVPLDSLAAPVGALLSSAGLGELAAPAGLASTALPPGSGQLVLGAGPQRPAARGMLAAEVARAAGVAEPRLPVTTAFQSASALPPASEAGGRPGLPRKAPAPAAGGAAAVAPTGLLSASFLALLVLAALVAPTLLRRLRVATVLPRRPLFVGALERPG